jgi:GNAT superfamily N-acetyltransferase
MSDRDTRRLEHVEAEAGRRVLDAPPPEVRQQLGICTRRIRDGVATALVSDTAGTFTRASGFGFDAPVDEALVVEVLDFFRTSGSASGWIGIAPGLLPDDWADICARQGLQNGPSRAKLTRKTGEAVSVGTTDLTIRRLTTADAAAWWSVLEEGIGLTDARLAAVLEAGLQDPLTQVYGAWDGEVLAGAGAVCFVDGAASLNTGVTIPAYRHRGVQSALIAARAAAAADAGCDLLVTETDASTSPGPSRRNMLRAGFEHRYDRTSWIWKA